MSPEHPLPVRYVLYTHYAEGYDFAYYRESKIPPCDLPGVKFLVKHLSGLSGLLTWPGYEGLLVLFYAPGFDECLAGIENRDSIEKLRTCEGLAFAQKVHDYIDGVMNEKYQELLPRLRFITPLDLYKVFGRIRHPDIAERLRGWMVGDTRAMTYDSPKIIEAIVRLRLLGSGVPVFRVDHDVLFRGDENCAKKNLEFSSTIGSCLTAYQLRRDAPNLASFIFSASYDHKVLQEEKARNDFHAWGRAYATRVFPALPFDPNVITETLNGIEKRRQDAEATKAQDPKATERKIQEDAWDDYAVTTFRSGLARKFFGFDEEKFRASELGGIGEIGAHPMGSVISGAMLYLSDGAILDLPPFSNFGLNVSWIDDHLKYCLHRELRHLRGPAFEDPVREPKRNDLLRYSKIDDVIVQKTGRRIDKDLRWYIFDVYLPNLLRGTILDSWITPDPLLKYRREELSEPDRAALDEVIGRQSVGLLPFALQDALASCKFNKEARKDLKNKLEETALKRITQVRRQWASLTDDGTETFASIWAKGMANSYCPGLSLKYSGIVRRPDLEVDVELADFHLSPRVKKDLVQLIEDACDYIEWTRDWPIIVQVVRSIEQGTLRTDLNYDPQRAESSDPV